MKRLSSLFLLASLALLVSCGGKEEKKEEKESLKIGTSKEAEKQEDSKTVEVSLTGNDMMKFNKN